MTGKFYISNNTNNLLNSFQRQPVENLHSPIMQVDRLGHGELLGVDVQLVGGGGRVVGARRRDCHAVCADAWRSTTAVKRRGDRTDGCRAVDAIEDGGNSEV